MRIPEKQLNGNVRVWHNLISEEYQFWIAVFTAVIRRADTVDSAFQIADEATLGLIKRR